MNSTQKIKAVLIFLTIYSFSCEVITLKSPTQEIFNLANLRKNELLLHNAKRKLHGSSPLVINETLNNIAQSYADELAKKKVFSHSKPAATGKYGENLFKAWGSPSYNYPNAGATSSWYS